MSNEKASNGIFDNEELYKTVVEFSPNAVLIHCEGKIIYANPSAVRLYGAETKEEMIGLPILHMIHSRFHDVIENRIKAYMNGSAQLPMVELKCVRLNGEVRDTEVLSVPIMYAGKSSFLVTVRDVTDQKITEKELKTLSWVVKQSPVSIVITNRSGLITYVNQRFEEVTGYKKEEVIGKNPRIIQSGQTPKEVYEEMWSTIISGKEWRGEICNKKKDGSLYWDYIVISGLKDDLTGEVTHFVAVKNDITARMINEAELTKHKDELEQLVISRTSELQDAKERAETANKAKSIFLANMSHEIRTPMNGIIGMTNILRRQKGLNESQMRHLSTIENCADHLLGVINSVLDISKIEAGKLVLDEVPINVNSLLIGSVSVQSQYASEKGLRLIIENTGLWPSNLSGDSIRIQQVLINYIANAIKFTQNGSVTVRVFKYSESDETFGLRFEVIDTGIGISEESLPRLFNVFEQSDNSITRKYGGTGLGLSITKKLVNLMGGNVGVESRLGEGSMFWFTIQLKKILKNKSFLSGNSVFSAEEIIKRNHAGKRVLVVDDEPINREVVKLQLEYADLVVDLAKDGKEAISMASMSQYAAIFMDMQMPNINGLDATRQIRMLPEHKKTPIISLTANAFAEDGAICLSVGMNDFLSKPFTTKVLFETLLKWIH